MCDKKRNVCSPVSLPPPQQDSLACASRSESVCVSFHTNLAVRMYHSNRWSRGGYHFSMQNSRWSSWNTHSLSAYIPAHPKAIALHWAEHVNGKCRRIGSQNTGRAPSSEVECACIHSIARSSVGMVATCQGYIVRGIYDVT